MTSCARCGQELGVGRYCTNCGHKIGEPVPPEAYVAPPAPAVDPGSQVPWLTIGLGVLVLLLLVAVLTSCLG